MNRVKILKLSLAAAILLLAMLAYRSTASSNSPSSTQIPTGLGPNIEIWNDIHDNYDPAVAYNPQHNEYMVVWSTEQGPLTTDVWARRVHADGGLDNWFNVDSSAAVKYANPVIAYSPVQQEYMVVYTDNTDSTDTNIYANTFSWNGASKSTQLAIDTDALNQAYPAIAYNRLQNEFLIVYQTVNALGTTDVIGKRYRLSDHTLLPAVTIASSSSGVYRDFQDVAYNPKRNTYFVTYVIEDTVNHRLLLAGRGVSADLANHGPEVEIAAGPVIFYFSAIAAGADGYLVAYSNLGYIYGRLISGDGVPLGDASGFPIPTAPPKMNTTNPDVAYLGTSTYLVTWHFFDYTTSDTADVFGQYVNANTGSLLGPNILIDSNPYLDEGASAACNPSGACLIAYMHNGTAYPGGNIGIRGRIVSLFNIFLPFTVK
jgi:hypothetical protein